MPALMLSVALAGTGIVECAAGRWGRLHMHYVNGAAYGGLIANVGGLLRYAAALLTPGRLLDATGSGLLLDVAPETSPPRSLGWTQGRLGNARWCGHAGGGAGYYAELRLYPELRCASALLLNVADFRDRGLLDALDRCGLPEVAQQ